MVHVCASFRRLLAIDRTKPEPYVLSDELHGIGKNFVMRSKIQDSIDAYVRCTRLFLSRLVVIRLKQGCTSFDTLATYFQDHTAFSGHH